LQTDGNVYWSDTMQLSTYIPSYAEFLQKADTTHTTPAQTSTPESLVIGEHYVPPDRGLEFMQQAREVLKRLDSEVIYGTLRAILPDKTSFMPWAKRDYLCTIFNLRTPHTPDGIKKTHDTFRALTDVSLDLGGSFYLTYHRAATAAQVRRAYPQIDTFMKHKLQWDPQERLQSEWYRAIRMALG
jgi:FAD/FMN-containing dehydrogenase